MTKYSFVYLFVGAILLSGCSKYGFVNLSYPIRPAMYLPDNVKTVAIVNRSLTDKESKQNKVTEAIATGEIAGSDKLASDECLKAVFDRFNGYRGVSIVIPQKTRLYGTGTRETPELLNWDKVQSICTDEKADALLVLENFDSNSNLVVAALTNQVQNVMRGERPRADLPSQVRVNVLAYWRLYDPSTKTIVDQYTSTRNMTFNGVIIPPDALPNAAYAAGEEYVSRFLPSYYTVRRDMYKKGKGSAKGDFQAAFRRAEVANWQGAIDAWIAIVNRGDRVSAGRACLDIAVSYEVLKNTDQALQWAKKAYEDYGDQLGRDYAKILLERKDIE